MPKVSCLLTNIKMSKWNCTIINCPNSTYKVKKWKQGICYENNDFDSSCKREDCIHCIPLFKLYCFPSMLRMQN